MKYHARQPPDEINVGRESHVAELLYLGGGLLALIALGYFALGWAADAIVERASPQTEASLTKLLEPGTQTFLADTHLDSTLQQRLDRLLAHAPRLPYKPQVHVSCEQEINAVALPGGHIVVFRGLLEQLDSENALAMVLGHELSHLYLRHHLHGLGRGIVFLAISALLGLSQQLSSVIQRSANDLIATHFSREQEAAADRLGASLVVRTFGHAAGLTDFFEQMAQRRDESRILHWFSSHPDSRWRVEQLLRLQRSQGWPVRPKQPLSWTIKGC